MKLKVTDLDMAHEGDAVAAAREVAERFELIVELTGKTGGGGWPTVNLIGTPAAILKAPTTEGGWASGDDDQDAETVFFYLSQAVEVFG